MTEVMSKIVIREEIWASFSLGRRDLLTQASLQEEC
jgi:hypothetical protein